MTLENRKLKNEIEAKNQMLKDLRREIDTVTQTLAEERAAWSAKEGEYLIQIRAATSKKASANLNL